MRIVIRNIIAILIAFIAFLQKTTKVIELTRKPEKTIPLDL